MLIVKILPQSKIYHFMSIYRYEKVAQLSKCIFHLNEKDME